MQYSNQTVCDEHVLVAAFVDAELAFIYEVLSAALKGSYEAASNATCKVRD